jgi:hypothetical protein
MERAATMVMVLATCLSVAPTARAMADEQEIVTAGTTAAAERQVLKLALRALPRRPARIAVIDLTEAKPDVQVTLRQLDAFVLTGSPVIYVVRQSRLLEGALAGSATHVLALATVIWHEMAHADGADESQARKQEEALWSRFIRDQRVDPVVALRYLDALTRRPDHQQLALR